jgi:phosphate transport system substrate-binding protein
MYTGAITAWNDPRIVADNDFLSTCNTPVYLTARAETSGTTFAFKDYLSKRNPAFNPPDSSPNWPAGAVIQCRGTGSTGEAACVRDHVGAITTGGAPTPAVRTPTHRAPVPVRPAAPTPTVRHRP